MGRPIRLKGNKVRVLGKYETEYLLFDNLMKTVGPWNIDRKKFCSEMNVPLSTFDKWRMKWRRQYEAEYLVRFADDVAVHARGAMRILANAMASENPDKRKEAAMDYINSMEKFCRGMRKIGRPLVKEDDGETVNVNINHGDLLDKLPAEVQKEIIKVVNRGE